jgi:para-nitrobenzyl esterase
MLRGKMPLLWAVAGAAVGLLATGPAPRASTLTEAVDTTSGPVRGLVEENVHAFMGIRYAASPAGQNRWLPPQPVVRGTQPLDATTPGSACPQPQNQFSAPFSSEDCLFLNVWTPADARPFDRLPVFLWIHGGALVNGAGFAFDPSVMVAQDHIIVVTINYRLGALGWLADAALADAAGDSGNYGLTDQQFAMTWVRNNIAHFGGDPFRVTIGGESAGGLSTLSNVASPTAKDHFHRAIVESGAYMLFDIKGLAAQEALGAKFAAAVGCTGTNAQIAACLRAAPVATLLADQGVINTSPTSGVATLPQGLSQAFGSGEFNRVPIIDGSNLNEGRLFEPDFFDPTFKFVPGGPLNGLIAAGVLTYEQAVALLVGPTNAAAVAALYPPANFPNPDDNGAPSADEAFAQIFTDLTFSCNALFADQMLAKFVPVYAYEFADPNAPNLFEPLIGFSYGASHASELQYLFAAATLQGPADAAANAASPALGAAVQPPPLTPGGDTLAAEMKGYWTDFVKVGTPDAPVFVASSDGHFDEFARLAFWPLFNGPMPIQSLVPGPAEPHPIFDFATEHQCPALQQLGLVGG